MDHFRPDNWIDFVRSVLPVERAALMQTHLDQGCKECLNAHGTWRLIADLLSREQIYQPPHDTVAGAKAAYQAPEPGKWLMQVAEFARLVFDSFLQPSFVGVRAAAQSVRQLVHECEPFTVDLRLESDSTRKRIYLTGQIINSQSAGESIEGIDVVLLRGPDQVGRTTANGSGEFNLDFRSADDLQLFINIRGKRAIGIALPTLEN